MRPFDFSLAELDGVGGERALQRVDCRRLDTQEGDIAIARREPDFAHSRLGALMPGHRGFFQIGVQGFVVRKGHNFEQFWKHSRTVDSVYILYIRQR